MFFTNDSTGYFACSNGKLLKTQDFGQSFIELLHEPDIILNDVTFLDDSSGYCVGSDGFCSYTTDYGKSWIIENTGVYNTNIQMFTMENGYIQSGRKIYSKNNMLGLFHNEKAQIIIYPNPANEYINIKSYQKINNICIYNIFGVKEYSGENHKDKLDISQLNPGIHFLRIKINNNLYTKKKIKN